jgi:hypothetical protein
MDWEYVETGPEEAFCRLEHFGIKKTLDDGKIVEFMVTVREYHKRPDPDMAFFAEADKQVNQKSAPYTPVGWGSTRNDALWECIKAIRKFPYQP